MRAKDLTGQRFGRLIAVRRSVSSGHKTRWFCTCDCGGETVAITDNLLKGNTQACGCRRTTHAKSKTPEYRIWTGMVERCCSPASCNYKNYGALGVKVCSEWRSDFTKFLAHVGQRPSPKYSIDRYPDCRGDYEPGNVRWATASMQARNKRTTKLSEEAVFEIKNCAPEDLGGVAQRFGISRQYATEIRRGVRWAAE